MRLPPMPAVVRLVVPLLSLACGGAQPPAELEDTAKYGLIGPLKVCADSPDGGPATYPCAIQRTVRASFGHFLACYQEGRKGKPSLEGRITVRFVAQCIVHEFEHLSFPPPSQVPPSGTITVVYPLIFSREDSP
ncbi:hypothetical protein LZC95_22410 [Pendulispora brunnea]|uniref:TonB C-terminal domain-containing protein n=1 Tax=Pendulispora brunnea TaxID=2905690 RepID=A0ABZ2KLL6_9BACT